MVVGIDTYSNTHLTSATKDANSFVELLIDVFKADKQDVCVLLNGKATKENISEHILSIPKSAKRNDLIFFYFSGFSGDWSHEGDGKPGGFICPHDYQDKGVIPDHALLRLFDQVSKQCGKNIVRSGYLS